MTPVAYVLFACASVNGAEEPECSVVPNGGPPFVSYSTREKCEADLKLRSSNFAWIENHRFYNSRRTSPASARSAARPVGAISAGNYYSAPIAHDFPAGP